MKGGEWVKYVDMTPQNAAMQTEKVIYLGPFLLGLCLVATILLVIVLAEWKIFEKAGEEGWKVLIPFYGIYLLYKIVFGRGWLCIFAFIPGIRYVFPFIQLWMLGTVFGKSTAFKIGLMLLSPIFMLMLAYDDSIYLGSLLPQRYL